MKNIVYLVICFYLQTSYAQFGGQQIISTEGIQPRAVAIGDVDGDSDMDVVSATSGDHTISWYQNFDGQGSFGSQIIINNNLLDTIEVILADLDGDTDLDVIATSPSNGEIVWHENLDGQGNFGSRVIISTAALAPVSVIAVDIDGDMDLDLVSASLNDNKISWYENLDGMGTFGGEQIISTLANGARDVFGADIDGDLDMDIVAAASAIDTILWYENTDGSGTFGTGQIINSNLNGALAIYCADLNGDDTIDVIAAGPSDDKIVWHENTDGLGTFGPEQIVSSSLIFPNYVYVADVDNDMDLDILSSAPGTDVISWHENLDANGTFSTPITISTEIMGSRGVLASDLDSDTALDVLSFSSTDDKIAWYRNLLLANPDFNSVVQVYPNPTTSIINFESPFLIEEIFVYDLWGRMITSHGGNHNSIDLSLFASGTYFIKLYGSFGEETLKVIKQ